MIYMTEQYQGAAALFNRPLTHARILWDNTLADAAFWANSAREGFAADRARSADTVSWWWPSAAGVLIATMPAPRQIDAIALAAHTIGSEGVGLIVSARVGGVWQIVHDESEIEPADDEPIILAFGKVMADAVRITLDGSARVGVVYAGTMLEMAQPAYSDLPPLALIRSTTYETNKSVTGQFMGRSVESTSRPFEATWTHLKEAWVREHFAPFMLSAREAPFFIALRPGRYPTDVGYALTSADMKPERMGVKDYLQVQMSAEAHAGPEG